MYNRFLSLDDLTNMPTPQWLIEGMFESNALVMLAGPSYSFKSFLLIDWMLCMATGRNWNGKPTVPCKVAYALGEGKSSLLKRLRAWVLYNKLSHEEHERLAANFRVTFDVPQLAHKTSVDHMLDDLDSEEFEPDVISIDTFARSFVGLDENDQKDTGMWVEQADRLRQMGHTVIFLHHTKKNQEFGVQYRGSTAIMAAMDTAMTLVRDNGHCQLTVTKQKDHDEGQPLRFKRVVVPIGGSTTSVVLVPTPTLDEQAAEDYVETRDDLPDIITKLLADEAFPSDRERAKKLSEMVGIGESAARSRISRHPH